jgi:hypothetical protein
MNALIATLTLIVGYLGIVFGYVLALIAPEELRSAQKLFKIGKFVMFGIIFLLTNYYLSSFGSWIAMSIFSVLMIFMFVLELVYMKRIYELFNYVIFTVPYIIIGDDTFRLVFASVIFVYGLVAGTLLKKLLEL